MATRSTIAVQLEDGTVQQVYCHWDGYLSNNGRILHSYYNSFALAKELVQLGDISTLGRRAIPFLAHSFDNPEKDTTVYYGRDRGEADTEPRVFADFNDYQANVDAQGYEYIFRNGEWLVCFDEGGFFQLEEALLMEIRGEI